jgi:RHS repeat-associated protein
VLGNVGAATVTHDTKGNITAVGSDSYGYSSENFLTSGPGSATLGYDPMGRLYQVAQGAGTTRMGYDGLDRIVEYDGGNIIQRRYIHGPGVDNPIAWYEGSGITARRFLSSDERGSVISVTDGSGTLLNLNKYDEYGVPQSTNLGRFGYTGQAWVPEIGLWYYKARFLWSDGGRFMQTDPLGYEDGMNWYVYAGNNPIMFADPLGLSVASGFTPCVGDCSGTITGVDNGDSTGDFVISVPRPTGERNDYQMQKLLSMSQAMYMVQRAYNFVTAEVIGRLSALTERNREKKLPQCAQDFLEGQISGDPGDITLHEGGGGLPNVVNNSVTHGSDIYLTRNMYNRTDESAMRHKFHEIGHVSQNSRMGLGSFNHFSAYLAFGGHDASPLEQAAQTFAKNTYSAYEAKGLNKTCQF